MSEAAREREPVPRAEIRRFDVFAEYNRLKAERSGFGSGQAKSYGLWLAKVVAARKLAKTHEKRAEMTERLGGGRDRMRESVRYLELGGQPQTPELFDREIVGRMGEEFYRQVFAPKIAQALLEHKSYERIRDTIRQPWNKVWISAQLRKSA